MVSLGKLPFVHRAFSANFVLDKLDHFQARSFLRLTSAPESVLCTLFWSSRQSHPCSSDIECRGTCITIHKELHEERVARSAYDINQSQVF